MHLKNIFLILLFVLPVTAYGGEAIQPLSPEAFIKNTSSRVISLLQSGASDGEKQKKLTSIFLETIDGDWMGKFVLGSYWQSLTDEEKRSYLETYRKYLVSSYVTKFKGYNHQEIIVKGMKDAGNDQYMVEMEIKSPADKVTKRVEYRLKLVNGHYRIRDIIAEGVSLLTTQRSEFGSILGSQGIESLKRQLNNKTHGHVDNPNSHPDN